MELLDNLFDYERKPSAGEAIFFKIFELFVALASVKLAWEWGLYTLRISDVVLPLGMARYVDVSFMFDGRLPLANAGAITVLVVIGFFRLWRGAYLGAFLLLHLQYAARFSLGEIPHSSNMLGMTLLGLAIALLVFRDGLHRRRFTLGFTYFFVGLGYTLAGISKLIGTGLNWSDGRHLWLWVYEKSVDNLAKTGTYDLNVLQELVLSGQGTATAFLTVGLLTELFAFLAWWKRTRTPALLAVIALHIGIYLVMNIFFTLAVYELVLLALPWAAWLDALTARQPWMHGIERVSIRYT
ncbi:MAG: hypothetical protein WD021_02720 [Rhodothermales bacterium]